MSVDERVIKAAAQGIVDGTRNWSRDRVPAEWPVEFAQAEAAIRAADAARADAVKELMKRIRVCDWKKCVEAERELFALLGIEEA